MSAQPQEGPNTMLELDTAQYSSPSMLLGSGTRGAFLSDMRSLPQCW